MTFFGYFLAFLLFTATVFMLTIMTFLWHNASHAPDLSDFSEPLAWPMVSVLIPARDEEQNLRRYLPHLLESTYPHLEILVLDDQSTDASAEVVRSLAARDGRLRLLQGDTLPEGWLGKNWACHQLSRAARGEMLIFCDADVCVSGVAIERTVAAILQTGAGAVTALPHQDMRSWTERAIVPLVMHLPTAGFLALRNVTLSDSTSFVVANGQWFAFRRRAYEQIGGHAAVRDQVVEDMALGRALKRLGLRLFPMFAVDLISVRMYANFQEIRRGFSKNLYGLTGYNPLNFTLTFLILVLVGMMPWAMLLVGHFGWALPLALFAVDRLWLAVLFRHPLSAVWLHPVGALLVGWIGLESLIGYHRGTLAWKGRPLSKADVVTPAPLSGVLREAGEDSLAPIKETFASGK